MYQSCVPPSAALNDTVTLDLDRLKEAATSAAVSDPVNDKLLMPPPPRPGRVSPSRLASAPTSSRARHTRTPTPTMTATNRASSAQGDVEGIQTGTKVRRFPSVTVVDDTKGHWRSISLISVHSANRTRSGSGTGSLRNSTNDLLEVLKRAEDVERERLMKTVEGMAKSVLGLEHEASGGKVDSHGDIVDAIARPGVEESSEKEKEDTTRCLSVGETY